MQIEKHKSNRERERQADRERKEQRAKEILKETRR